MTRTHKVLVATNAALLGCLALATAGVEQNTANAEAQPDRARGSYTMISAAAQGQPGDALYVVDNANQDMLVLRWNSSRNQLEGVDYVRFDDDREDR